MDTELSTPHGLEPLLGIEEVAEYLAAEWLGHTDPRITIRHYIRRNEMVNPVTTDLLGPGVRSRPVG